MQHGYDEPGNWPRWDPNLAQHEALMESLREDDEEAREILRAERSRERRERMRREIVNGA